MMMGDGRWAMGGDDDEESAQKAFKKIRKRVEKEKEKEPFI